MSEELKPYWVGETQLMGFGESDSAGAWIKFQVLPEDLDNFRGMKGTTFDMALGNPNEPIAPEPKEKGGKMSIQAGIICKEKKFQEYCVHLLDNSKPEVKHELCEQTARNTIYRICKINSRKELDQLDEAKGIFMNLMKAYEKWCGE